MYLEKKRIGNKEYYYLKTSIRYKNKVRIKTVAYIGKDNINRNHLEELNKKYKKKEEEIKKLTLDELRMEENSTNIFLGKKELEKVEEIKKKYGEKLKNLNVKTKEDMFRDFLIVYSYNTNAIEGNTFTLRDTDLLLNKNITPEGKDLREVNDHLNAKEVFLYNLKNKITINHDTIIKIHSMLMKNIDDRTGSYRTGNVRVHGASFKVSPFEYIKIDMDILLKWYRKNRNKMHPLVLASIFHHKFERIHPFFDGNGRTGRALMNIILFNNNLPFIVVPNAQRKEYYEALVMADKIGLDEVDISYTKLVKFFYYNLLKTYNTIFARWT